MIPGGVKIFVALTGGTMFVGAYWSARKESREAVATRLVHFLSALAIESDSLSTWFLKGRTKASARTPLELDMDAVASVLKVNRRDVDGDVMSELGFSLGIWNGGTASVAATVGAYSPYIRNSVVLSFIDTPADKSAKDWRRFLDAAVRDLDPDHAVVTSNEHLMQRGTANPWEAGWFTYRRGSSIEEHPFK